MYVYTYAMQILHTSSQSIFTSTCLSVVYVCMQATTEFMYCGIFPCVKNFQITQ